MPFLATPTGAIRWKPENSTVIFFSCLNTNLPPLCNRGCAPISHVGGDEIRTLWRLPSAIPDSITRNSAYHNFNHREMTARRKSTWNARCQTTCPRSPFGASTPPTSEAPPRVAVIGAGISGLICARTLVAPRCRTWHFLKKAAVWAGGWQRVGSQRDRLSTTEPSTSPFEMNVLSEASASWEQDGIVAPWER